MARKIPIAPSDMKDVADAYTGVIEGERDVATAKQNLKDRQEELDARHAGLNSLVGSFDAAFNENDEKVVSLDTIRCEVSVVAKRRPKDPTAAAATS